MANGLLEFIAGSSDGGPESQRRHKANGYSISVGIVTNNLDSLGEGRVQVKIPSLPAFDVMARLVAIGAGAQRGFLWVPEIDDEVLVAFNENDERDAYILGGLWSLVSRPPVAIPTDFLIKRVIKTGKVQGVGHEVEFDDALQSITITSSTKQKIKIDPLTIELSNTAGTLSIKMDNTSQTISITSAVKLELKATQISIQGAQIELKGGTISIQSAGPCAVTGLPIKLN
jgi:phage baseplate assembly protein gpV